MPAGVFSALSLRNSDSEKSKSRLDVDLAITDLAAISGNLQSDWVTRFETAGRNAFGYLPTGLPAIVRGKVGRGIEAQACDDGVSVTVPRVNRDPFAATAFAEIAKFGRVDRRLQYTGSAKRVRNCAGTIVATIQKRFMSASKNVRFTVQLVGRPNGAFHRQRRRVRCGGLTETKARARSRNRRARRRKKVRVRR